MITRILVTIVVLTICILLLANAIDHFVMATRGDWTHLLFALLESGIAVVGAELTRHRALSLQ
jgi:hypothetical protein